MGVAVHSSARRGTSRRSRRACGAGPAAALALLLVALGGCKPATGSLVAAYRSDAAIAVPGHSEIPLGRPSPAAPVVRATPAGPAQRVSAHFEFAEQVRGYTLTAVALDRHTDEHRRVAIDRCGTIDLDAFDESSRSLFATPVLCDGRAYAIDLVGARIVVRGPHGLVTVMRVRDGRVVLNGVSVLAGG